MPTQLDPQQPVEGPGDPSPQTRLTRRSFLRGLGLVSGAVVVVGGAAGAWRIVDQGILSPGSGEAFDAWRSNLAGGDSLSLVRAAVLAANAHGTQPWMFRVAPDRVDLYADLSRSMGTMDPLGREMELSLGAALENLLVAAPANGYAATTTILPDPADRTYVARVDLTAGPVADSALFGAIPNRHTDRTAFDVSRAIPEDVLDELRSLAEPPAKVVWLDPAARDQFGWLTVEATAAIVGDPDQARDDFAWYRQDWHGIQRTKDGITMDAAGLGEPARLIVRLLPPLDRATMQQGWIDATRDRHIPTASALGLITVDDRDDAGQRIAAGRLFQRVHLLATTKGVALQPLNQVLERVDREQAAGLDPVFTTALKDLAPSAAGAVLAFRIGYSTASPALSPRRPAEEVIGA